MSFSVVITIITIAYCLLLMFVMYY